MAILHEAGYPERLRPTELVELRRRLVDYYLAVDAGKRIEFPHEIGVFLGYPAQDVRGFMEGRKATCRGAWHAYGDEQLPGSRFRVLGCTSGTAAAALPLVSRSTRSSRKRCLHSGNKARTGQRVRAVQETIQGGKA